MTDIRIIKVEDTRLLPLNCVMFAGEMTVDKIVEVMLRRGVTVTEIYRYQSVITPGYILQAVETKARRK